VDAAAADGPVDGANGRAAHESLGRRHAAAHSVPDPGLAGSLFAATTARRRRAPTGSLSRRRVAPSYAAAKEFADRDARCELSIYLQADTGAFLSRDLWCVTH
jgi:hypothetical protein